MYLEIYVELGADASILKVTILFSGIDVDFVIQDDRGYGFVPGMRHAGVREANNHHENQTS